MKLLLCGDWPAAEQAAWQRALAAALPEATFLDVEQARAAPGNVQAAVVANPPPGSLQGLPNLRLIQSLWAGVDRLLADPTLPADVPLARMVDPAMTAAMAETVLWAVLSLHRGFFDYAERQRRGVWQPHAQRRASDVPVLVLGAGQMAGSAAVSLTRQGYAVQSWRHGADLTSMLGGTGIVVNLLPLTAATRGLLNARFFAALPRGAAIVNVARGAHVVDADLLAALDSGQLRHAVLDVFHTEPLPAAHAFWRHPRVTLLPHAAAQTDPRTAAAVAAANLRAAFAGEAPAHLVDRARGY